MLQGQPSFPTLYVGNGKLPALLRSIHHQTKLGNLRNELKEGSKEKDLYLQK